jgi:hypothetical protein
MGRDQTVRENIKSHNVRNDLLFLDEVPPKRVLPSDQMPRMTISRNQAYFDLLMKLLGRDDSASKASWELI